jgi:hypothetical protein
MKLIDGDAVAIALARYVRNFVAGPAHGVTVMRLDTGEGSLLGVVG